MRKTLYLKFLLAYLIFGMFGFIAVSVFVPKITTEYLVREKADLLYEEATLIANTYAGGLYTNETNLETVNKQLNALAVYMKSSIQIINPSGRLVLDSNHTIPVDKPVTIENFDPTFTGNTYYNIGTFFDTFQEKVLTVLVPITSNYKIKGYVAIHYYMEYIETSVAGFLNISYLTLIIIFFLSLIVLIFFTEMVYLPIKKITYATEQYASGNMHYEFQVDSDDEIGYLAACLNYMASEIAHAEDDQKKFIANVSHDFRSPLTSIRGYLEAMLDGTIPPEQYLTIVVNETERLTKLTNGMLALNNLNTKGVLLDITSFDINQVIRNTAASFEGTCKKKSIAIEVILTGETMYVDADMGKIQQVLYNLMDNAIESCLKIQNPEERYIKLECFEAAGQLILIITNPATEVIVREGKLMTTKKARAYHGVGMSIVTDIVKKYDGVMDVTFNKPEFSVRMNIPN